MQKGLVQRRKQKENISIACRYRKEIGSMQQV
jgi:hypothetical protein